MKLACKVCVNNRLLQCHKQYPKNKHVNSTIALCRIPKTTDYCIILFTSKDKHGTKYSLKGNITGVSTRFINDGKATIQFKEPPHDIFLQAEVIQLKSFLRLLKAALENKLSSNEAPYSSLSVTPISSKNAMPKKLIVLQRSDYPLKGFPRTLEILQINNINRCALDKGILLLTRLRVLDVSNNCIEYLHEDLKKLPHLRELNVSSNHLHKSSYQQWSWIGGNLCSTLVSLNLANNSLKYLPEELVKLTSLEYLNVQRNHIERLPLGIGRLKQLKVFICSDNRLISLPGSIKNLRLQMLNVANNNFEPLPHGGASINSRTHMCQVWSLKEYAAKKVLACRLYYSPEIVPLSLVRFLDHAKYCICGEACFSIYMKHSLALALSLIATELVVSSEEGTFVPVDGYFCSLSCYHSYKMKSRGHIIR